MKLKVLSLLVLALVQSLLLELILKYFLPQFMKTIREMGFQVILVLFINLIVICM